MRTNYFAVLLVVLVGCVQPISRVEPQPKPIVVADDSAIVATREMCRVMQVELDTIADGLESGSVADGEGLDAAIAKAVDKSRDTWDVLNDRVQSAVGKDEKGDRWDRKKAAHLVEQMSVDFGVASERLK